MTVRNERKYNHGSMDDQKLFARRDKDTKQYKNPIISKFGDWWCIC